MSGQVKVYQADDALFESFRNLCDEDGMEIIDMRTPFRRLRYYVGRAFIVMMVLYFVIVHYHGFKVAMGWAQEVCR